MPCSSRCETCREPITEKTNENAVPESAAPNNVGERPLSAPCRPSSNSSSNQVKTMPMKIKLHPRTATPPGHLKTSGRRLCPTLMALSILLGCTLTAVNAQNYAIAWFTIDGGGGTSSGGAYSLSGTIGQPEAGMMTGGSYTLQGGFWSVVGAVQTTNAPLLSIEHTTTNSVIISWPAPATGWQLQENANLTTTNWVNVATAPQEVGARKQVVAPLPTAPACRFYRLHKPN